MVSNHPTSLLLQLLEWMTRNVMKNIKRRNKVNEEKMKLRSCKILYAHFLVHVLSFGLFLSIGSLLFLSSSLHLHRDFFFRFEYVFFFVHVFTWYSNCLRSFFIGTQTSQHIISKLQLHTSALHTCMCTFRSVAQFYLFVVLKNENKNWREKKTIKFSENIKITEKTL